MRALPAILIGPALAALAVTFFSLTDVTIKFLSGDYALHQLMLVRNIVGLSVLLGILMPLAGGPHLLRSANIGLHLLRGSCLFFANMSFFLGLAVLPIATATALFFVSPILISFFSMLFLGEHVGPRRWIANALGLLGVVIVLRPGSDTFQVAALLPIVAAFFYALLHVFTRMMRVSENAVSLTFYVQLLFLAITICIGLAIGDGRFAEGRGEVWMFLLRAWVWPAPADLPYICALGLFAALGGYAISEAYRRSEAALVAPMEYVAMPLAVLWGISLFGEWPDAVSALGIALILCSGLYMLWREHRAEQHRTAGLRS